MKKMILVLVCFLIFIGCGKNDESSTNQDSTMFFPSTSGLEWETTSVSKMGWNGNALTTLEEFLIENNTKSFMILVNGKIVIEEYFNGHSATSTWEWNSAGKSLVASIAGIAQQNQLFNIDDKVSKHLGNEWTNMPLEKEKLILVKHLLSMTSGIDDTKQRVIKENLTYAADAGKRWAYGNVFQKLIDIVEESSNQDFDNYFNEQLANKIGMDGNWNTGLIYTIYHSTTRSMARFGLLALNHGKWNEEQIIDEDFFIESINSSQDLNPSYGYLWWLNGKSKYMIPASQDVGSGSLVPNAPFDMYAAMGANDQRIYVIPSKNMVVIRMGEAANPDNAQFAVSGFDNKLWERINELIQ